MKKYLLFCLFSLSLTVSCSSNNTGNPLASQDQLLGAWIQESANEFTLNTNNRFLTLTFRADATFEIVIVTGRLSGNPITDTLQGTYFVSGSQLTTVFSDGTSDSVSVKFDGDRMIFEDGLGNVSVYRR
ncbi:MAG: hypothetical protein ACI8V2_000181 [Candidatus Latescibacterota bacterium]|jgi:hypothetical protein